MNIRAIPTAQTLTANTIVDWLRLHAEGMYGGESVTQLEHALQCATLARDAHAPPELVVAALLHDLGQLVSGQAEWQAPHEIVAADLLSDLFGAAVTEPIRLHVQAKRYLCAIDPLYRNDLSESSKRSLILQGGPFRPPEALAFISRPYSDDAIRLRLWDDAAKVVGASTPSLETFAKYVRRVALPRPHVTEQMA